MSDERGSGPAGPGPVCYVTGAAGDIGRATALALAARGWRLALTDHPAAAEPLRSAAADCERAGADVWVEACDVTDEAAVTATVQRCGDEFGVPAGLFDNAGVQGSFTTIDGYPIEDARHVFEVNVLGAFAVLSIVTAAMVRAGNGGAVVCTASMAGVTGAPNMPAYSASKAAVIGFVKSAAKDLAPAGIRVNAVSPAFIGPGRMWDRQVELQAAAASQYYDTDPAVVAGQMVAMVPLRRLGSPDEVARVVTFLLSDEASYLTGINVEVAGGSA